MRFTGILQLIIAAGTAAATANAGTVLFPFDGDTPGTATTFTDTVNGLSATFSSSADPGGFVVYQTMFETLTGNVLADIEILPNSHLVIANSDGTNFDPNQPSELAEFTAAGAFVGQMPMNPQNGGAFGVAIKNIGWGTFELAAVDDNTNTVKIWTAVVP